jgi:hypothetical protein
MSLTWASCDSTRMRVPPTQVLPIPQELTVIRGMASLQQRTQMTPIPDGTVLVTS